MEEQSSSKKIVIIVGVVVLIVALVAGFILLRGKTGTSSGTTSFGAIFGGSGTDTPRQIGGVINPGQQLPGSSVDPEGNIVEPLFRQLSTTETAGATAVVKNGKTFVRYIARENGYVYDVDPITGESVQITGTLFPGIYEAYWAEKGGTVILRYLKHDDLTRKDDIKTTIANLVLPLDTSTSTGKSLGTLSFERSKLSDNISSISVSPNGTRFFYLLPIESGVSGTIVDLPTRASTEVLRSSFGEWLPQLLNDGNVILTTKASTNVAGYAYLYDTKKKELSRLIREKKGLTTLASPDGGRIIFSENILGNTTLGLYDVEGFQLDEGVTTHISPIQLATLPEKCVWSKNLIRLYCGAFASTPKAQIPDDWYQGSLKFSDTFWTTNTSLADIVFLADPSNEIPKINEVPKTFDVYIPFIDLNEDHFYFVDKNDSTLWSMRLIKSKFTSSEEIPDVVETPVLTPDEMKDAAGSIPSKATTTKAR